MGSSKPKLTMKQAKFVKAKSEGKSGTQAALEAYDTKSPKVASVIATENLAKPSVKEAIDAEMEKQGITMEKIIAPVAAALEAKTRLKSVVTGETVEIDAPDLDMQLKGHDRAVRLMSFGMKKDEGGNTINFNFGSNSNAKKYIDAD